MTIKARKKGLKLAQVPTTYKNRKSGKSKFKMIKMGIRYGKIILKNIID
ncbi:hypothetical protein HYV79_03355 [Candidatus Woesearchaeota archaeon]|nr:hypothetical protein [Candidatus Woesearchaeota archaeon]